MKLIALDVGTKRIGVAKADSKVRIAIPYNAIEVNGEEFQKISSLARAWDIDNFVLGMPRSNEGNETKQSLYVRKFAKELKRQIPDAKICFQDESLTSVEAEKRLKGRKKPTKKGDIDSEAAAIILQDFLEEKTGKSTSRAAAAGRKTIKGKGPRRHGFLSVLLVLLVLLVLAGGAAFIYYTYNLRPVAEIDCENNTADACRPTTFLVESGSGISQVANQLKEANLIRDPLSFQIYFRLNSHGEHLKAGEYSFNQSLSAQRITELLLHGADSVFSFTVLPGDTVRNIKKNLVDAGYTEEEVEEAFAHDYREESYGWVFEGYPEDATSLEGYLYGETYEFFTDDSAETIVGRFIEELAKVIREEDLQVKFAAHGLSLYQGITLASVVQREAGNTADMAKVAQIFYNRLGAGINLGSDVTASYAVDLVDPDRQVYVDNAAVLEIDSPYNTRKNPGLPYGPIANPSVSALEAVAAPDESVSEMFFFLTGDDGQMYYAADDAGHQANIENYCQKMCSIAL